MREYNEEFPTKFEYIDESGHKRHRKYMLPEDAPTLEEANLRPILSEDDLDDLEKTKGKIIVEIGILNRLIRKNSEDRELIKEQMNYNIVTTVEGMKQIRELSDNFLDLKSRLTDLEHYLLRIDTVKKENERVIKDNEAEINKTAQENKRKINKYQEELNLLNRKAFNSEQLPTETENEYYARLRSNAELTEPEENLGNAKKIILDRFKNSLKEIIRNPSKIEQISNSLDPFGEVENKFKLLKKWNLFKTTFIKTFGENNPSLSINDIIEFMAEFLENDGVITNVRHVPIPNLNPNLFVKQPVNQPVNKPVNPPAKNRKQAIRRSQNLIKNKLQDIYNKSQDEIMDNPNVSQTSIKPVKTKPVKILTERERNVQVLTEEIMNKYPNLNDIQKRLQEYNANIDPNSDYNIFPQDMTAKRREAMADKIARKIIGSNLTNEQAGFGIQMEKIPEKVKFGKLVILLDKLYYKNILAAKHHNMISIVGLKNTKVSDKFVKIIMNYNYNNYNDNYNNVNFNK